MNQYLMNQVTDWLSKPENQAKMAQTWPGKMVQSALHAAALPGEVYAGKTDPMSEDSIQRAFELAGNVTGSAFAKGVTPNAVGIGPTKLKAAVPETQGIRAYHGSPHDFEKFDLSKIGTGEGAQSYGHGLYFAENPAVAREYRNALSGNPIISGQDALSSMPNLSSLEKNMVQHSLKTASQSGLKLTPDEIVRSAQNDFKKFAFAEGIHPDVQAAHKRAFDALESLIGKDWQKNPGKMYEVDIRAKPEQFLDWDKPIPETTWMRLPDNVRHSIDDALDYKGMSPMSDALSDYTGRHLLKSLQHHDVHESLPPVIGKSDWYKGTTEPIHTSEFLNSVGIPGIRYLDQGSRNIGEGTSNYVVFDPSIINILRKYNTGGAVANAMRFANG